MRFTCIRLIEQACAPKFPQDQKFRHFRALEAKLFSIGEESIFHFGWNVGVYLMRHMTRFEPGGLNSVPQFGRTLQETPKLLMH